MSSKDFPPLVSKYLSSTDQKVKAQLLVLINAQGLSVASPPPEDLNKIFHVRWYEMTEERRQEILKDWKLIETLPQWKGAVKILRIKKEEKCTTKS